LLLGQGVTDQAGWPEPSRQRGLAASRLADIAALARYCAARQTFSTA